MANTGTEPGSSPCQWHCSELACDGFDCYFGLKDAIPVRDIEPLGHGGHGWVSKVECSRSHQVLARKTIKWHFRRSVLRQIQEEVRIMRSLSHSHIVRVRGSYIQSSTSYSILLEPVADCDLSALLNIYSEEVQRGRNSTLLSASSSALSTTTFSRAEEILLCSFGCLSSALTYIHSQKMKHKDVKPTNILVHNDSVLFTDFGLATDFSETANSLSSGPTACTRIWAAPEVANPEGKQRGRAADIFSLGCVFTEILTVLAQKSLVEFHSFREDGGSECFWYSLNHTNTWLDGIESAFKPCGRAFLNFVRNMIQEDPDQRPTAATIWEMSRSSKRDDQGFFCGNCCRNCDVNTSESSMASESTINPGATVLGPVSGRTAVFDNYAPREPSDTIEALDLDLERFDFSTSFSPALDHSLSVVDTWGISSIPDEHEFDLGLQQLVGDIYTEKAFPTIQSGQQQKSNNSRLVAPLERIEQSARSELVPRGLTSKVRPRGRALGSHLEPKVAKAARDMRKTVACWHCVLQRDKCGPGDICERCLKRSYSSGLDAQVTHKCIRTHLLDLAPRFTPEFLRPQYQNEVMQVSMNKAHHWVVSRKYIVALSWGISPPLIEENVQEGTLIKTIAEDDFESTKQAPRAVSLGRSEFSTSSTTAKYEQYLSSLMFTNLMDIPHALYPGNDECDALDRGLLCVIFTFYESTADAMVGDMMKLLMITHCFCRSPQLVRTIPNLQMVSRRGSLSVPNNVRLGALHEQIKCGLVCLWNKYLSDILAKCHRGLRSTTAKHISKALPLICTFLGLAIILEKIEDTLHDTPNENETYRAADPISSSFHDIEEGFTLLLDLCRMSYGRDAALQVRAKLPVDWSSPERDLITDLQCLVSKHLDFLSSRSSLELPIADSSMYRTRLSSKLLLWLGEKER